MADAKIVTPWMNSREAGRYLKRDRRFILKEIHAGRLQAARVGGKGEILTCQDWCDAWVVTRATPVPVLPRRRG